MSSPKTPAPAPEPEKRPASGALASVEEQFPHLKGHLAEEFPVHDAPNDDGKTAIERAFGSSK